MVRSPEQSPQGWCLGQPAGSLSSARSSRMRFDQAGQVLAFACLPAWSLCGLLESLLPDRASRAHCPRGDQTQTGSCRVRHSCLRQMRRLPSDFQKEVAQQQVVQVGYGQALPLDSAELKCSPRVICRPLGSALQRRALLCKLRQQKSCLRSPGRFRVHGALCVPPGAAELSRDAGLVITAVLRADDLVEAARTGHRCLRCNPSLTSRLRESADRVAREDWR